MTQEIIQMARDSGMHLYGLGKDRARFVHHLETFAKLVTEAERDEILQAITDQENQPSQFGTVTLEYHQEKMKQWEDLFDRMSANFERASDKAIAQRIVPLYTISPQRTEQNFCSRCGKRTKDMTHIHTCTPPPQEDT